MRVRLEHLTKTFADTVVLQDVSIDIADHELFFLLGPSGCGKTTLLRLVAGFYPADAGQVRFGDKIMDGVPPHLRNTGMVFQNYALWPHLTVAQNVAYGLEVRSVNATEKKSRVAEALEIVRMSDYAERQPNQLSGGQQQRVALARALVIRPDVLLLDEPLSNLDAKLRLEMREEIRRIHDQTRITTLYVTHDQKESLSLADRLAVMHHGRVEQIGDPRTVYRTPANRFVADFIGETNWLPAEIARPSNSEGLVRTEFGEFQTAVPCPGSPGQKVWLGIRPEAVQLQAGPFNNLPTTIGHISYLGEVEEYQLLIRADHPLKAVEQNPSSNRRRGDHLTIHLAPQNLLVFPIDH
jgi:iron(III) transport system ATP-binding protein